jgi:HlyD family secretion protein
MFLGACASHAEQGTSEPFQGTIELDEQPLAFELGGRLTKVLVKRGDEVQAGQVLAELDDTAERPLRDARLADLRAAGAQAKLVRAGVRREDVRATEAQLAGARETEGKARKALARQEELEQKGAAAPAYRDDLQAQVARAQAERLAIEEKLSAQKSGGRAEENSAAGQRVLAAQAALDAAEARLKKYVLRAPSAGRVIDVYLDPGEVVAAGGAVVSIADTKHPYTDVFVPQARLSGLRLGMPMRVQVDAERVSLAGRIEDIGRKTEFTPKFLFSERERPNLVVRVRVRVDDPEEKLHAGVPAFVAMGGP